MSNLTGKTIRVVVDDYFGDESLFERVETFVTEMSGYRTAYVQHMENSVVFDFQFEEDVGNIAMATKLVFAKFGVDVLLLP